MTPKSASPASRVETLNEEITALREDLAALEADIASAATERAQLHAPKRSRSLGTFVGFGPDGRRTPEGVAAIEAYNAAAQAHLDEVQVITDRIVALQRQRRETKRSIEERVAERGPLVGLAERQSHAAPLAPLQQRVADAQAHLAPLLAEYEAIPAAIEAACAIPDSAEVVRLQLQGRDLPLHIDAARAPLLQAQIDLARAEVANLPGTSDEDLIAAQEALRVAKDNLEAVQTAGRIHTNDIDRRKRHIRQLQTDLSALSTRRLQLAG